MDAVKLNLLCEADKSFKTLCTDPEMNDQSLLERVGSISKTLQCQVPSDISRMSLEEQDTYYQYIDYRRDVLELGLDKILFVTLPITMTTQRGVIDKRTPPTTETRRIYTLPAAESTTQETTKCKTKADLTFLFAETKRLCPFASQVSSVESPIGIEDSIALHELTLIVFCDMFALDPNDFDREIIKNGNGQSLYAISTTLENGEKWVLSLDDFVPKEYCSWKADHDIPADRQHETISLQDLYDNERSYRASATKSLTISSSHQQHTATGASASEVKNVACLPQISIYDGRHFTISAVTSENFQHVTDCLKISRTYFPQEIDFLTKLHKAMSSGLQPLEENPQRVVDGPNALAL